MVLPDRLISIFKSKMAPSYQCERNKTQSVTDNNACISSSVSWSNLTSGVSPLFVSLKMVIYSVKMDWLSGSLKVMLSWWCNLFGLQFKIVWVRGLEQSVSEPPHSLSLSAATRTIQDGVRGSVRMWSWFLSSLRLYPPSPRLTGSGFLYPLQLSERYIR